MILTLQRTRCNHLCTTGTLLCEEWSCSSMEAPRKANSISVGERVPANQYMLFMSMQKSPIDDYYRLRFGEDFHHGMIAFARQGRDIYVMMGNYPADCEKHIIIGTSVGKNVVNDSQTAYEDLYPMVHKALKNGELVMLDIKD